MINKYSILAICAMFSNCVWSASFDCDKAKTQIEKKICSTEILSSLDDDLGTIYMEVRSVSPVSLKENIESKQRKWLKKRNEDCKGLNDKCLESSYKDQISYLTNVKSLIAANKRLASAFKQGTLDLLSRSDVGINSIELTTSLDAFRAGDLYSSLSIQDRQTVTSGWDNKHAVTIINEDINEDYLVDSIVYQKVGSGRCSKPFLLIRQPDMSLELAKSPSSWLEDGAFCNTTLTIFGIEGERYLGNIEKFGGGGGRLNVYADMEDTFSLSCSTLFGVKTSYATNRFIPYADEFRWVFRNKTAIEKAINSKSQGELSIEFLSKVSEQEADGYFVLDVNGDGIEEELKLIDDKLSIKNSKGKFVAINKFWRLNQTAKKYKHTSYNTLSEYGANYLFFIGADDNLYMIYWSNGELGWRQSQLQIMFLYRLGSEKPKYMDSLLLEPSNTYYAKEVHCK